MRNAFVTVFINTN